MLLGAVLATATCDAAQDTVADSPAWTVGTEPLRVYGSIGEDPDAEFGNVSDVARGPDGAIAVADGVTHNLSFFSAQGSRLTRVGREGEGPGEFSRIAGLVTDPEGRLFVFDEGHQRLSEWTFDGEFVADKKLTRRGTDREIGEIGRFEDGSWYAREGERLVATPMNGTARDTVGFFELTDGVVGEPLTHVPGTISTQFEMEGQPPMIRHALLSPRSLGVKWGRCLLAGTSDTPLLRVLDSAGAEVGEVRLMLEAEPATEEHRSEWATEMLAMVGDMAGPEERMMLETFAGAIPMADRVPFAEGLLVDDLGYIWVQRYKLPEGSGSTEWRVFTEKGSATATVVLPQGFAALEVSANAILGVFADELGRQDVRVYSLDRGDDTENRPIPAGCA